MIHVFAVSNGMQPTPGEGIGLGCGRDFAPGGRRVSGYVLLILSWFPFRWLAEERTTCARPARVLAAQRPPQDPDPSITVAAQLD